MLNIFFVGLQEDKYIIKVDHHKFSEVVLKDEVH